MAYDIPRGKLSSMEEDFKEIGLLPEGEPPGKDKELAEPGKSKKKLVAGADDDTDLAKVKESGDIDNDTILALEARVAKLKSHTPMGRKSSKKSKRYYKQHKGLLKRKSAKRAHSAHGKKVRSKHMKTVSKMGGTKKGKRIYTMGLDRITNMIEDVQDLMTGVLAKDFTETVKGYANIAIIAEQLAGIFSTVSEDADNRRLRRACNEMAELCAGLAEEAAQCAEALENIRSDREELRDLDRSAVESHFQDTMRSLLDSLEFYDDLMSEDGATDEHGDKDNDLEAHGPGAEGEHDSHEEDAEGDEPEGDDEEEDAAPSDDTEEDAEDSAEEDDEHEPEGDDEEEPAKGKKAPPFGKKTEWMKNKKAKHYAHPWKR